MSRKTRFKLKDIKVTLNVNERNESREVTVSEGTSQPMTFKDILPVSAGLNELDKAKNSLYLASETGTEVEILSIKELPKILSRNADITKKFYEVLNSSTERRVSKIWPPPNGFLFALEIQSKLLRAQMLQEQSPSEILVFLIDEGREMVLNRTTKMFVLPDYFWTFPSLIFTTSLKMDSDEIDFPFDSHSKQKCSVHMDDKFVRLQVGNQFFKASSISGQKLPLPISKNLPQRKPVTNVTLVTKNSKNVSDNSTAVKIENVEEIIDNPTNQQVNKLKNFLQKKKETKISEDIVLEDICDKIEDLSFKERISQEKSSEFSADKYISIEIESISNFQCLYVKLKGSDQVFKAAMSDTLALKPLTESQISQLQDYFWRTKLFARLRSPIFENDLPILLEIVSEERRVSSILLEEAYLNDTIKSYEANFSDLRPVSLRNNTLNLSYLKNLGK